MKGPPRFLFWLILCSFVHPAAAAWELRRDDLRPERPPVSGGLVEIDLGKPDTAFPRYLNEIGVKVIRIRFRDDGPGQGTLSVVWTGGSMGPDQFSVSLDGVPVGKSRRIDTARRPYAWYRDDFKVMPGKGPAHVLEIRSPEETASAIEFAGLRWSGAKAAAYQPLCYESIGSLERYETALKGKGIRVESPHFYVFAPVGYTAQARALSAFLEKAYGVLRDLYGIDTSFRFSVEHYPAGHTRAWGGISGAGTIGYPIEALERFGRVGTTDVRGFAGYTEEMSHGFKAHYKATGTYEALGVAVQEDAVRRLCSQAVADAFWLPEHRSWDETHRAYLAAGRRNPDPARSPDNVLYTRILNDVFLRMRTEYGPALWPDFFAALRKRDYPLHAAKNTERMGIYADVFSELLKRDMRGEFERWGIDLKADPPWGSQTYGSSGG